MFARLSVCERVCFFSQSAHLYVLYVFVYVCVCVLCVRAFVILSKNVSVCLCVCLQTLQNRYQQAVLLAVLAPCRRDPDIIEVYMYVVHTYMHT
jgi:hypothetical protein